MKNNCDNNYILFNKGLGETNKMEYINWISDESAAGIGLTNNLYSKNNNKISDEIEIVTIDTLKLDKLDYIKIIFKHSLTNDLDLYLYDDNYDVVTVEQSVDNNEIIYIKNINRISSYRIHKKSFKYYYKRNDFNYLVLKKMYRNLENNLLSKLKLQ